LFLGCCGGTDLQLGKSKQEELACLHAYYSPEFAEQLMAGLAATTGGHLHGTAAAEARVMAWNGLILDGLLLAFQTL
jgi:hypothetical protein